MLLCLLYLEAIVAGATSNVVVNFILLIVTALIPGGLLYGTGKALGKHIRLEDEVYLITKTTTDKQLDRWEGPYTVIGNVGNGRYHIRNGNQSEEGIACADVLLKKSKLPESPTQPELTPTQPELTPTQPESTQFETDDEVYLITARTTNKPLYPLKGPYKVKGCIGQGRYHIKKGGEEGIATANVLRKKDQLYKSPEFCTNDEVYLIITNDAENQLGQLEGPYTVIHKLDERRYRIRKENPQTERDATAKELRKMNEPREGDEVYLITASDADSQLNQLEGPYTVKGYTGKRRYHIMKAEEEGIASADVLLISKGRQGLPPERTPTPE